MHQDSDDDNPNQEEFDQYGNKIIKLRELTKLEQEYFDNAREKHKNNITKDQVVQGKTFKGHAFISKPAVLEFNVPI